MKKNIKRISLFANVFAIIITAIILVGSTFAWFSDSTTSYSNKIQAGTLKVDLELLEEDGTWNSLKSSKDPIFDYENWEPGYTDVKILKVENEGTLALKWKAQFISKNNLSVLANIIDVYVCPSTSELTYPTDRNIDNYSYVGTVADFVNTLESTTNGILIAGEEAYLGIALKMRDVGNEYQGINIGGVFDIRIIATQVSLEEDGFSDEYDHDAIFPEVIVEKGVHGGVNYTLNDMGVLTVWPAENTVNDPNSNKEFKSGVWREAVIYKANGSAAAIDSKLICNTNAVKSLVIAEGVTAIGSFAAKFPNLTGEVVIPASVTYIGQEAFQNTKITKLIFEEGGTKPLCIAPGAFKTLQIEELVFPSDREVCIHCWAFNDCSKLKTIIIPDTVKFLGQTHLEYSGMDSYFGGDSQVFARCWALETMIFETQAVHDRFFGAPGNRSNINAIGGVETIIQENQIG